MISKSKSPVTFCHNDLQEGNILLPKASSGNIRLPSVCEETFESMSLTTSNPSDPRLVLIDFEYASYNYRGFDFANHFVEYTIDYDVPEHPHYQLYPEQFPEDHQDAAAHTQRHQFVVSDESLSCYLTLSSIIEFFVNYLWEFGVTSQCDLDSKAKELLKETLPFVPVSHFFWGVWGLLQVELSPVGFGFAEYGRDRLGLYFQTRHLLELLSDETNHAIT
ncbi:hypothetical protein DICVIV_05498 [Dictyocaulus viviparus]|uniref:Choline/ethanolamine kinase n=1 Tax=Dictyocaulus viviparus TaxID=29172 RepID=A0A0D8XUV0_DICVI|nr:hypothetical protein DICVIV_05498 [Dictyocaulus viviparus]